MYAFKSINTINTHVYAFKDIQCMHRTYRCACLYPEGMYTTQVTHMYTPKKHEAGIHVYIALRCACSNQIDLYTLYTVQSCTCLEHAQHAHMCIHLAPAGKLRTLRQACPAHRTDTWSRTPAHMCGSNAVFVVFLFSCAGSVVWNCSASSPC